MYKKILVIQHHPAEGPGRIAYWAADNNVQLTCVLASEVFAQTPNILSTGCDGIIILGGPMNVVDNPNWMQREREFIQQMIQSKLPLLAICLGAQLVATELGAAVIGLKQAEHGWLPIQLQNGGTMQVPQWHEQRFVFSNDVLAQHKLVIEASSALCEQQVYRNGHLLGLQFHPEWDEPQMNLLRGAFGNDCPFSEGENTIEAQRFLQLWLNSQLTWLFS
ncbi:type 1 glutamine amidotransferase [Shewanella subflava]|uniref:Type 1 glutamine amidotransferase n=1 Tax=Shewanella subflava TaxID=2986476 RepID=A0ABT3I864_9GAMM|nr:type 1 glutamine amidotransferase [Shewanella subflava]MCW3172198.1 type 1 glutamine amidotransferase [Shewanella subflava]